jgi:N-acetylmuramic acid 6-phosphate etherase
MVQYLLESALESKSVDNLKLLIALDALVSEQQNPDTLDIDLLSSIDIVSKINQQDHQVSQAISRVIPVIAETVDKIVNAFKNGGRLVYMGAGTSGRLGVLDAVECVPTFGIEDGMVIGLLAGGESAMFKAKEGIEDQQSSGADSVKGINLNENDVLVGIAASGRTPYVIGGLKQAAEIGAVTVALSCNPDAEIADYADYVILPVVGPEPLTGSTRMKSGTAQKMVLNMLSTAAMIRIGKSYKNLMVDVKASNEKLYARGIRMVMLVTGVERSVAEQALSKSNMQVKVAILMLLADLDVDSAQTRLADCDGFLRKALMP